MKYMPGAKSSTQGLAVVKNRVWVNGVMRFLMHEAWENH